MFSFAKAYPASKRSMQLVAIRGSVDVCDSHSLTGRHNQWAKRFDPFY